MSAWRLLADIGGTNARFARWRQARGVFDQSVRRIAEFPDFETALQAYLDEIGGVAMCESAAISAAGPVLDGEVRLTNAPWRIGGDAVSRRLGGAPVSLFNDLEAVAMALPFLQCADVTPVGGGPFPSGPRRMLALNVGTGFGAAAVFRAGDMWVACPGEAGHMSLGAQNESELAFLAGRGGMFTIEDALSGRGLTDLYRAQCGRIGADVRAASAEEVVARSSSDPAAQEALRIFTVWLGRAARDLVLSTASWGGAFLTGGVIGGWSKVASFELFRVSFEAGNKMRDRLRATFTGIVNRQDIALVGLANAPRPPSRRQ